VTVSRPGARASLVAGYDLEYARRHARYQKGNQKVTHKIQKRVSRM